MANQLRIDAAQVARLTRPGPRYTSYPTVPVWTEQVGAEQARDALARASADDRTPLSVYVHLPFCRRLCLYCGCTVEITRKNERVEHYLDAVEREVRMVAERLGPRRTVTQLHWGGGTPTHLDVAQMTRLHGVLAEHFAIQPGAEVSLEVHPHVTTGEQIDALAAMGFSRISLGVQDVDRRVQEVVRRDQTLDETRATVDRARRAGFTGVNIDLMYGLPAQDEATFAATLDAVQELDPDRLAVYGYAHVPWLKPAQKALEREDLPDAQLRARLFAQAVQSLTASDYEVIGLDHFAKTEDALARGLRDGSLHRNFMGYTTQRAPDMVAFGMSAIGDVGGVFLQNARTTDEYERAVGEGRFATVRGLVRSEDDDLRRAAIQALMCRMVLDLDELERETGVADLAERFAPEWERLQPLADEGFCTVAPRRVEVLPVGRLFLRHLAMAFDAYLEQPQRERFSQTV